MVQSQVRFNRVPEKVPEKVAGSGEGVGGFGFYCGYNHHRPYSLRFINSINPIVILVVFTNLAKDWAHYR